VPLIQFVHLVSGGETAAMSKRRGEFVTLDDLLDEIGVDATRFFMLRSSHDRTLDLDLDLARKQSRENPVYYVQYAHARIGLILAFEGRFAWESPRVAWADDAIGAIPRLTCGSTTIPPPGGHGAPAARPGRVCPPVCSRPQTCTAPPGKGCRAPYTCIPAQT